MPPDHGSVVERLAGPCCEDQVCVFARDISRASSAADTRRAGRWAQIQMRDCLIHAPGGPKCRGQSCPPARAHTTRIPLASYVPPGVSLWRSEPRR